MVIMSTFSERKGLKDKPTLQVDGISDRLKNKLWNCFYILIKNGFHYDPAGYQETRLKQWAHILVVDRLMCMYFSIRKNQIPSDSDEKLELLESELDKSTWNEFYDFFEYVILNLEQEQKSNFIKEINSALINENSGYRLSNGIFIPIISKEELNEIKMAESSGVSTVEEHLQKAKEYISASKKMPDYRNSVKESISAVETQVRIIMNNNKTLSENLKSAGLKLHPAIKDALVKLYAYTSDAPGIRHGNKISSPDSISLKEARFMLVICSSYINLIKTICKDKLNEK